MSDQFRRVDAGTFIDSNGNEAAPTDKPDTWICRRIADYPHGWLAANAKTKRIGFARCAVCDTPVYFNAARTMQAPKVCMQCAGIEPLPMEAGRAD